MASGHNPSVSANISGVGSSSGTQGSSPGAGVTGRILGTMFRGRFLEGLVAAFDQGELRLRGDQAQAARAFGATVKRLSQRHRHRVVHVEAPKGRSVGAIAKYLARYILRVAITDGRIEAVTGTHVTIKTRRGVAELDGAEFVRRFLLHVLPRGFRKVRHYGLHAPGTAKLRLEVARRLLPGGCGDENPESAESASPQEATRPLETCPACGQASVRRIFSRPVGAGRPRAPP